VRGNALTKIWHRTYNGSSWSAWQAMDTLDALAMSPDTPVMAPYYWYGNQDGMPAGLLSDN